MNFELSAQAALWFLPFVLPVCLWVAWSDLRAMKIPNKAVLALVGIYLVIGPIVLPLPDYGWRLTHLAVLLAAGIVANAAGMMGAGDAKFIAAAGPFVAFGDATALALIFAVVLLASFATHRIARATPLRNLAPGWTSWEAGRKFPMGLALGPTLALYLALASLHGA
ncbi:A24 family peptidase [Roseovarius autotrophicus]|uniref:A24 family peptidase n=1 Tax=Roseovarius autotrophicus TaxID=2824121 RepID=UPI0019E05FFE|nr:prepilin peptidase [Roseovarius autotrophicus]MBE0453808.1 prepilin peptidase [Roseovarius sp.]